MEACFSIYPTVSDLSACKPSLSRFPVRFATANDVVCYYRPEDSDADRLPDFVEETLTTNPQEPDTDGDGRTDGEEVLIDGTDPLSSDA